MELRQLQYFSTLCKIRNFTKTSEILNVAQPSISKAIQNLEDELGVQLIDRSKKPLGLTKAGERFFVRVEKILGDLNDAVTEVVGLERPAVRAFSIGISPMSGVKLKQLLNHWEDTGSGLVYSVIERSSVEIRNRLLNRELDLGWVILHNLPEDLAFVPIEVQEAVLILPQSSALLKKETISLADLKNERFAMDFRNSSSVIGQLIVEECKKAGFVPKSVVSSQQYHPNAQMAVAYARNNFGISLIPEHAVANVTSIPVISLTPPLTFQVGLAYRKDSKLTPELIKMIQYIRSEYAGFTDD